MLIGIMNNTFTLVTEDKEKNALMEKTKMYADFIDFIFIRISKFYKKRYLYVITPK